MEKLSADALRLALVTASMEYYKKYVEGNQDFDNSEQIKEELDKLEAAGLGGTKNAETLRTILESKKHQTACSINTDKHVIHHLNVSRCRNDYRAISV